MFMHGGFAHILFNMIALWSFGSAIEMTLGPKKYAIFYFVCGIGAYVLFNVVNYIQVDSLINSLVAQEQISNSFFIFQNSVLMVI